MFLSHSDKYPRALKVITEALKNRAEYGFSNQTNIIIGRNCRLSIYPRHFFWVPYNISRLYKVLQGWTRYKKSNGIKLRLNLPAVFKELSNLGFGPGEEKTISVVGTQIAHLCQS